MSAPTLPSIRQDLTQNNKVTPPFYVWFGRIQKALEAGTISDDEAAAAIAAIATILGSPDGTVANIPPLAFLRSTTYVHNGVGIGVDGTLAGGGVDVYLDAVLADLNDVSATAPAVGDALVWDGSEWAPGAAAGFVPMEVEDGTTFTIPAGKQAVWATPIELLGAASLEMIGAFVEVN